MNEWITFWKIVCVIGFASFYLVALAIIPLGARDLVRLLQHLARPRTTHNDQYIEQDGT